MAEGKRKYSDCTHIFKQDIEDLCRIFLTASEERKEIITGIIDYTYMLLHRETEDKKLLEFLESEFWQGVEEKKKRASEILGIDIDKLEGKDAQGGAEP